MNENLKRARDYSENYRRLLLIFLTAGVGSNFIMAATLTMQGISPRWATMPISVFCVGLIVFVLGLLMGEHRSLQRMKHQSPGRRFPWYKMGITWNIFTLVCFSVGVYATVYALQGV